MSRLPDKEGVPWPVKRRSQLCETQRHTQCHSQKHEQIIPESHSGSGISWALLILTGTILKFYYRGKYHIELADSQSGKSRNVALGIGVWILVIVQRRSLASLVLL